MFQKSKTKYRVIQIEITNSTGYNNNTENISVRPKPKFRPKFRSKSAEIVRPKFRSIRRNAEIAKKRHFYEFLPFFANFSQFFSNFFSDC